MFWHNGTEELSVEFNLEDPYLVVYAKFQYEGRNYCKKS